MVSRPVRCVCAVSLLVACGGGDEAGARNDASEAPSGPASTTDDSPAESGAASGGEAAPVPGEAVVPEEREIESSFLEPVVTGRWIWSANPQSGRVARVDAVTREVTTITAGLMPTYLAAIGGDSPNRAIVINAGGSDATLFRQAPDGELGALDIPIHDGATAWAIGRSGRWAIAWSDAAQLGPLDPTEGLQDVTVIDLAAEPPRPARFSVGYRPLQVSIDASETRAYAVTRDGISVIELGDPPRVLDDVLLGGPSEGSAGALAAPVLEDVPLTRDGRFALLRFAGAAHLQIIELGTGRSQILELPGEVSDIDIAGDSERAVAVVRSTGQVAAFELGAALDDPTRVRLYGFSGEAIGSAALPDTGAMALFFTNAVDSDRLAILDTTAADPAASGAQRVVSLKAPIEAVFPSPEGSHAIALLEPEPGSDRAGAFSVVPIAETLPPKIQGTDAPPFRVTLASTASGAVGLVTVRDDAAAIYGAYLVGMPSLRVDRISLSSPPIAAGVLPSEGLAFVAQRHPEGRITFIHLESGEARTLTGFELSSRVVTGATR